MTKTVTYSMRMYTFYNFADIDNRGRVREAKESGWKGGREKEVKYRSTSFV